MDSINLSAPDVEELVLASSLESSAALMAVVGSGLRPKDFGSPTHELLFRTMSDMMDRGQSVDATTLSHQLDASGKLVLVGGQEIVDRLASLQCNVHGAGDYADIIRDRSVRRSMFDATEDIVQLLHTEPSARKMVTGAENLVFRVSDQLRGGSTKGMKAEDLVELYRNRTAAVEKIPYPFPSLNAEVRGRERGSLTAWGGYSSDGKSTLGLASTLHSAKRGYSVAFFSLEMTDEELLYRLLSMETGIQMNKIQDATLDLEEAEILEDAARMLSKLDITTYHDPEYTPAEIRSIVLREQPDLVIADYLQRFSWADYKDIPDIAKQFKNIALKANCCVDLLSQLTPSEIRPGQNPFPVPTMNSWFGGKRTGHEANNAIVVWAHRELQNGSWERTGQGEIISLKQRGGKGEFRFPVGFDPLRIMWKEPNLENLFKMQGNDT